MRLLTATLLGLLFSAAATAHAAILASWNVNGVTNGPSSLPATYTDPALTSVPLSRNNVGPGAAYFGADQYTWGGDGSLPAYTNLAIDLTKYVTFGVNAPGSGTYSVDSIDFQVGSQDNHYIKTEDDVQVDYDAQYQLRWSLDNFAAPLSGGNVPALRSAPQHLDLTGAIDLTTPVTFRLYVYAAANGYETAGIANSAGDALVINGTAGVPEPASLGLLGLGGLALLRRHR